MASATQETSKGYLLSHSQLCVGNVNLNWGVCEGQEEDAAGREGKALDGTRGKECMQPILCQGHTFAPVKYMWPLLTATLEHNNY